MTPPPKDDDVERRRGTALENHAQTIISIIITGLIVWIGSTVSTLATDFASLNSAFEVQISELKEDNKEIKVQMHALRTVVDQATRDRFTGQDASRIHGEIYSTLKRHDERIIKLEGFHR